MPTKKTYIEVKNEIEQRGFKLLSTSYTNQLSELTIECPKHGIGKTNYKSFKLYSGCYTCGNELRVKNRKIPIETVKNKIIDMGYVPLFDTYVNSHSKFEILCPKHGKFLSTWDMLMIDVGCKKCGYETLGEKTRTSIEEIKDMANKIGCELLSTEYKAYDQLLTFKCHIHGEFSKGLPAISQGQGCKYCGYLKTGEKVRKSPDVFYKEFKEIHPEYELASVYIKGSEKVSVKCPKHGIFKSLPTDLLQRHGCPSCANLESEPQNEIQSFIQQYMETDKNTRKIITPYEIDIFIPSINLGIEYCGLKWHNYEGLKERNKKINIEPTPKESRELKNYHVKKMKMCNDKNVRLITIFEDEWLKRENQVKNFLLSVINKNKTKIFARKTDIKEVPKKEAKIFLKDNHIQGSCPFKVAYGLYFKNELIAIMTGSHHHRQGNKGVLLLSRLAFKGGVSIAGGASKLFTLLKQYAKDNGYLKITSWSDNRWSEGKVYGKLGFILKKNNIRDYSYTRGQNRYSKQSMSKRALIKKGGIGNNEEKMAKSLGFIRIWDCGKKTWEFQIQ